MKPENGQSLLEFALILPLLALLLVGIAEIGRAVAYTMRVNNAALAGAEYGSQNGTTAASTTNMEQAAVTEAYGNLVTLQNTTAEQGCQCVDPQSGVSCNPWPTSACSSISCAAGQQIVECVRVTTHATFDSMFNFPGLPHTFNANGKATMRVRQ